MLKLRLYFKLEALRASLISSFAPFGHSGRVTHGTVIVLMHAFRYDAYIYDVAEISFTNTCIHTYLHLCTMHVCIQQLEYPIPLRPAAAR